MTCSVDGCNKAIRARGLCSAHYSRWHRHGTTDRVTPTPSQRFWAKVDKQDGGCWLWTGGANPGGYGAFGVEGRQTTAHRFAYLDVVGPIPEGLVVDHLCRNRACVNPDHLEPVTNRENTVRGMSLGGTAVRTNRCMRGHEFTPENTITEAGRFGRACRECRKLRDAARQARRRSA